jgi:hypothetical protein
MLGLGREFTVSSVADPRHRDAHDAPHLARNVANFAPLKPLRFLSRPAAVWSDKPVAVELRLRIEEIGS